MYKKPKLTEEQKLFVVQRLALFETPKEVIKALKDEYNYDISYQALQAYDPTKVNGATLAKRLKAFFFDTRKKFLDDLTAIPIANKAYRLKVLDRLAKDNKSPQLIAQVLEQAAKEVGEAYTNKQKHELSGSVHVPPSVIQIVAGPNKNDPGEG